MLPPHSQMTAPARPAKRSAVDDAVLRLHAVLPQSRANGPGSRAVVWLQGCTLGCAGCFATETHGSDAAIEQRASELARRLSSQRELEGVTVTGGEPLQQRQGLLKLVSDLRRNSELSILLITGYRLEEIQRMPLGPSILACVDVLVDGPYREELKLDRGLRGSANQGIHLLTRRYKVGNFGPLPLSEIVIDADGTVHVVGTELAVG